ncbi:MAG: 6-phosphogluconate dehydrogenase NAD-binding protein [Rhizobacter sp.]|nr:6-phosphogluconate dehydrogenase NAD-binding protein [Rhizobacter sp.]
MKIAIIGTGVMGTGVGLTLLGKGHEVSCYNRTQENAAELVAGGAKYFPTARQAAENASHVIILVWNETALHGVLEGENGLYAGATKGQVYIDMSTQLPDTAKKEGKEFEKQGAIFVDAPVHGTKGEAHSGGLWIMVGGEKHAFDEALPVLNAIGESVHHMGATGNGCVAKLCGNHLVSAILATLGESLAMAEKSGLDGYELLKLWGKSDFRSPIVEGAGRSMLDHDFTVSFHLRTMVKDTELIRNYSESIGVPVMLSNIVHELNKISQNRGWGEQNATAIFRLFEEMAGIQRKN